MGYSADREWLRQVVPEYKKAVKPAVALTSEIVTIGLESWLDFGIWLNNTIDDIYYNFKDSLKSE